MASMAARSASLTAMVPRAAPSDSSCCSRRSHAVQSTNVTSRSASSASIAAGSVILRSGSVSRSAARLRTVSVASLRFVPIDAGRAALEPARHVLAGQHRALVHHAALDVGHHAAPLVERQAGDRPGLVADRPHHQLHVQRLGHGLATGALAAQHQTRDAVGAQQFHRAGPEAQVDAARPALRRATDPARHHLDVRADPPRGRRLLAGVGVQIQVDVLDQDVRVGQVAEFAQFDRCELGLRGTAPRDQVDVGDRAGAQHVDHVIGHVRVEEALRVLGQDADDVQCDVAGADHGRRRAVAQRRRPGRRPGGRSTRTPSRRHRGCPRGARPARRAPGRAARRSRRSPRRSARAGRPGAGPCRSLTLPKKRTVPDPNSSLKTLHDGLGLRVIGGDTVADQAVRRGQRVEHVDSHHVGQQRRGLHRVQAGRPRADNGDPPSLVGTHRASGLRVHLGWSVGPRILPSQPLVAELLSHSTHPSAWSVRRVRGSGTRRRRWCPGVPAGTGRFARAAWRR